MSVRKERGGVWSKIRSQYGSASNALSNLSISGGEHDGDTETDTVIHNALVKYYQKSGSLPHWLGEGGKNSSNTYLAISHSNTNLQTSGSGLSRHTNSSSLQDIYNRRQQASQERSNLNPPSRSQSFNTLPDSRSATGTTGTTGAVGADKFRNRLKSAGRANW